MELDWQKVDSVWQLTVNKKKVMKLKMMETRDLELLYCGICRRLFKVRECIVTCENKNYHYQCFREKAKNSLEISVRVLEVDNTSLKERIRQLEAEKKLLLGLACA